MTFVTLVFPSFGQEEHGMTCKDASSHQEVEQRMDQLEEPDASKARARARGYSGLVEPIKGGPRGGEPGLGPKGPAHLFCCPQIGIGNPELPTSNNEIEKLQWHRKRSSSSAAASWLNRVWTTCSGTLTTSLLSVGAFPPHFSIGSRQFPSCAAGAPLTN